MRRALLFIALFLSFIIYAFYRSEHTVISVIFKYLLSETFYHHIRSFFSGISLPDLVIYSFPQGLWVFSATLISRNIFIQVRKIKFDLSYMPLFFSIKLEMFQFLHITDGTFDVNDLCFAFFFWFLARTLFNPIHFDKVIVNKRLSTRTVYLIGIYCIVYLSDIV